MSSAPATRPEYRDTWVNPRFKLAALWTSMLFVFVYVDLFTLYRDDIRADLEAGTLGGFDVSQGFILFTTMYVVVPSLMVALSLLLPARLARVINLVVAVVYLPTIVVSAVDDWVYFVVGSVIEIVQLAAIAYIAWTWPKQVAAPSVPDERERDATPSEERASAPTP